MATYGSLVTRASPLKTTSVVDLKDDILLTFGNGSDQAMLNRSTTLTANTALTGVLIGTPVTKALAANSLIIGNQTADGDILITGNDGGHSRTALMFDSSVPMLYLYATTWEGAITTNAQQIDRLSVGQAQVNYVQHLFGGNFTSGGASTVSRKVLFEGQLTGAANDTGGLIALALNSTIVTQNDGDTIGIVAQLGMWEPTITNNDTITVAATLYVANAPSEGGTNAAIYIGAGGINTDSITDRTPFYKGDALTEIGRIKDKNGQIDHKTLPASVQRPGKRIIWDKKRVDAKGHAIPIGEEDVIERDLGMMISVLTVGVQQLTDRIKKLEG